MLPFTSVIQLLAMQNKPKQTNVMQPKNPLHGITLKAIVTHLVEHYGWEALEQQIPINCFSHDPSIKSSLTFLRKTPWAREKVEALYVKSLRKTK
jgi:uncharacterized protein (DUF2132 family)